MPTPKENVMNENELFAKIALEYLHIETLEVRNRDQLDFHDVGVASLLAALRAAYDAGRESAQREPTQSPRPSSSF
jgi:hypothetical protein